MTIWSMQGISASQLYFLGKWGKEINSLWKGHSTRPVRVLSQHSVVDKMPQLVKFVFKT